MSIPVATAMRGPLVLQTNGKYTSQRSNSRQAQLRSPLVTCAVPRRVSTARRSTSTTDRARLPQPVTRCSAGPQTAQPVKATAPEKEPSDSFTWTTELAVRAYEVGADGCAGMVTVGNMLQEAAWQHAHAIDLASLTEGLIPVLSKLRINVCRRYPQWREAVQIETWFSQDGRLAARRDWIMRGADGAVLATATSKWVLIDSSTRRLARVPPATSALLMASPNADNWAMGQGSNNFKIESVDAAAGGCTEARGTHATEADYDLQGHVNNVVYLRWALLSVPPELRSSHRLDSVLLEFRAEAKDGEAVKSVGAGIPAAQGDDKESGEVHVLHTVRTGPAGGEWEGGWEAGAEVARVQSVWASTETTQPQDCIYW